MEGHTIVDSDFVIYVPFLLSSPYLNQCPQIHSNTLAFRTPGARLVAITDPFEEMAKKVLDQTGGIPHYHKEWKEMLDRPDIKAVVIA